MSRNKIRKILYIGWGGRSKRSYIFSEILDINYIYIKDKPPYIVSFIKTIYLIIRYKPKVIILQATQGPAIFSLALYKMIFKFKLVFDIHPNLLIYTNFKGKILNLPFKGFLKYSDLIVLHDFTIYQIIPSYKKIKSIVLIDPPPLLNKIKRRNIITDLNKKEYIHIVFPSGTTSVENISRLLEIIVECKDVNVMLFITGPHKPLRLKNIIFTGYLEEEKFLEILFSSDIVLSWIERDYTITRSSLEAVYINKPVIVPDRIAFRKLFKDSALYLSKLEDLCEVIKYFSLNKERFRKKITRRRNYIQNIFTKQLYSFKKKLQYFCYIIPDKNREN